MNALAAEDEASRVLGLKWNYQFGIIVVNRGTSRDRNRTLTQRVVPSLVSFLYDSIGLVASYTVTARLLVKEFRRVSGQQWDDKLPDYITDNFLEWSNELTKLAKVGLHNFGDSSQDVFSSKAFLRGKMTRAVKQNRTCICARKSRSRTNETLDNP